MEEVPTKTETLQTRFAACGWRSLLVRALILASGWWILTEGDRAGLAFGVPTVLLALLASVSLPSPRPPKWSPIGLLRFAFAFLAGSLRGGVDVARRALAPHLRLSPTMIRFALRVPDGAARNLFTGTLSLMPGTLSANLDGDHLEVHVLGDRGDELVRQLQELEAHVARALGEPLEHPHA